MGSNTFKIIESINSKLQVGWMFKCSVFIKNMSLYIKEFLYLRLPSGLVIYALVAGSWYYMMYTIHGMDFINNFLGVHNFLRATQSEHPRWDVWWYFTGVM